MTDAEILETLAELDADEAVEMSSKDADFVESMMRLREGDRAAAYLTPARRKWALDIIERYGDGPEEDKGDDEVPF